LAHTVPFANTAESTVETIVDFLDDRDFGACMIASRLFWVCSSSRVRARLLSKTLTPDEAVLIDDPVRVLEHMRHRRGVRFRPRHLYKAAKCGRTDAVRWLVAHADWIVDDAESMRAWLARDGMAPVDLAMDADNDACYQECYYGPVDEKGGCITCAHISKSDRPKEETIRIPLCLCDAGDGAARRGRLDALDTLIGLPGYGFSQFAASAAAVNGHDHVTERILSRSDVAVSSETIMSGDIVCTAARGGRLDLAKRLLEVCGETHLSEVLISFVPYAPQPLTDWVDTTDEPDYYRRRSDSNRDDSDDDSDPDGDDKDSNSESDDSLVDANGKACAADQERCLLLKKQHNKADANAFALMQRVIESGIIPDDQLERAVNRALLFAVSGGRMLLVALLHEKYGARLVDDGVPAGHERRDVNNDDPLSMAAYNNDVRVLRYMVGVCGAVVEGPDAMDSAARQGALASVTYLVTAANARPSPRALKRAAANGHANTVSFLCTHLRDDCRIGPALRRALAKGHDHVVALLLEHASSQDVRHALAMAGADGYARDRLWRALRVRNDLQPRDLEVPADSPKRALAAASLRRQLDHLEYKGAKCLEACVKKYGRDNAVIAYGNRPIQDHLACNGKTDLLRVVLRMGIGTVTRRAMVNAAGNGYIHIMRLLHDHYGSEGPWAGRLLDDVVASGRVDVLAFMDEHFDWTWWSAEGVDAAAAKGHLAAVRFLYARRRPGVAWCTVAALSGAVRGGQWRTAAFLHAAGARCALDTIDRAIAGKKLCCCLWVAPLMEAIRQRSLAAVSIHDDIDIDNLPTVADP
jgi:hypothetical protein